MRTPMTLLIALCFVFLTPLSKAEGQAAEPPANETASQATAAAELTELLQSLASASLREKRALIDRLESQGQEQVIDLFKALLEGKLFVNKSSGQLLIVDAEQDTASAPLSGAAMARPVKSELKKIRVNNKLRVQLRKAIARLTLNSKNPARRLVAAQSMLDKPDVDNTDILSEAREKETEAKILEKIELSLAIIELRHSEDANTRRAALNQLSGSLEPAVQNTVTSLLEKNAAGDFIESDAELRQQASLLLDNLESKAGLNRFVEQLFFGLSLGSVLLLIAIGLAITFGVMGVINMAHGELMMLGAYTTYVVQLLMPNHIAWSLLVAIPAAFLVSGSVGVLIERGVIRFLHGRPLETLLATFGISLILQQAVRSIFSPLNRPVQTPEWMSGQLDINPMLSLTWNRIYILMFALLVFAAILLILKRSTLGLKVRAVAQNRAMAKAIGINTGRVDALTFGLGSGVAGLAGVALSQLTNVGPNLGQAYIIDSFMVVVFGGAGNLWGSLVAGFSLGVANKFMEPATGAVLANILVLVFIILFIQKRPRGLFPQKGRAAD